MRQIIVLSPVGRYAAVDRASVLIEDSLRIAIWTSRREHGFPDVELFAAAASGAQRQLALIHFPNRRQNIAEIIPLARPGRRFKPAVDMVCILLIINIDRGVMMKVHGIGTRGIAAIVFVGVEDLYG